MSTYEEATHLLLCHKGIGRAYWAYTMRCNILKEMPDKERYKIQVFGYQTSTEFNHESRVRYVNKNRITKRVVE